MKLFKLSGFHWIVRLGMIFMPLSAHALPAFLESAPYNSAVESKVARMKLRLDVPVVDGTIFDGVTAALKYRYQAEPSYMEDLYTRYDQYDVGLGVRAGVWIDEINSPFGPGFSVGSQIIFARQFKTQEEALTATPYTPLSFPVNAERALNKLQVGDFVSFKSNLSLTIGVEGSAPLTDILNIKGATHLLIRGQFQVQLNRMPNSKVRVKLIAIRDRGADLDAALRVGLPALDILGLSVVDTAITRAFRVNLVRLSAEADWSDLLMFDYVFDLSKSDAVIAYNNLMTGKLKFKPASLATSFENRSELQREMLTDLTEIESLARRDIERPTDNQSIRRIFRGSDSSHTLRSGLQVGLRVLRIGGDTAYSDSRIQSIGNDDQITRFTFSSYTRAMNLDLLFGLFSRNEIVNADLLFLADQNYNPQSFVTLILSREIRRIGLSTQELRNVREQVEKTLPKSIFKTINWKSWNFALTDQVNVNFFHQLYFNERALALLPKLTRDALETSYGVYLDTLPQLNSIASYETNQRKVTIEPPKASVRYRFDIQEVVDRLFVALDRKASAQTRKEAFSRLSSNDLFRETGGGFIVSLLPLDQLADAIFYQMHLHAQGKESVDFSFGKPVNRPLFDSLRDIRDTLHQRTFDLRLINPTQDR